jgi:succinyl-CoA:acetate CoA-transferase
MQYIDVHLSHVAQDVWFGFFGKPDLALVEVTGVLPDGRLIPSSSVGNNKTWLDLADKVLLEVNSWQSDQLEGMHDVYYGTDRPPNRTPILLTRPDERIGTPYLACPLGKVIAVVEAHAPDRLTAFALPDSLLPIQSGMGNVANAVMEGLQAGPFEGLTAYTEMRTAAI